MGSCLNKEQKVNSCLNKDQKVGSCLNKDKKVVSCLNKDQNIVSCLNKDPKVGSYLKDLHHAFFQVYGVKNAPKFLLQKWTPNDLIIKCIVRGHIAPSPPREPQITPPC